MIGDSDVDILTARAIGARNLGCTYGLAPEALAASHPDAIANHPADWLKILSTPQICAKPAKPNNPKEI